MLNQVAKFEDPWELPAIHVYPPPHPKSGRSCDGKQRENQQPKQVWIQPHKDGLTTRCAALADNCGRFSKNRDVMVTEGQRVGQLIDECAKE
jgi:hypothetical protein